MRRSMTRAAILVTCVALLAPVTGANAPASADELTQKREELDDVVRSMESIVAQLDAIADEIEAIDRRLGAATSELRRIRADLAQAEDGIAIAQGDEAVALELLAAAESRLGEVEVELAETRSRLQGRLVQTFKYGRTSSADLVMRGTVGALDLHEVAVNIHTVGRITDDDRNLITAMEELAAEQRDLIAQATAARVAAVEARDTATRQRDRIAVLEAEQRSVVSAIDTDRRRRKEVFDRLEADKDALAALASALTEQIRRLELANLSVLMPVGGVFVGVPDWAGRLPASGQPYSALIASAAATQGVDGRLLAALTWSESAFRPNAVSRAGAAGMTQLMPGTARGLGLRVDGSVDQRFDPEINLNAGARYLRQQIVRFGSVQLGLAAYNAGPGNVVRYGGIPPFSETQFYVYIVLRRYEQIAG
jgi:soluble lytic murein transglycosylase-like protein